MSRLALIISKQTMLAEHLLCAGACARYWGCSEVRDLACPQGAEGLMGHRQGGEQGVGQTRTLS